MSIIKLFSALLFILNCADESSSVSTHSNGIVLADTIDSLVISSSLDTILINAIQPLTIQVFGDVFLDSGVQWSVSDSSLATINNLGELKGLLQGIVIVKATSLIDSTKSSEYSVAIVTPLLSFVQSTDILESDVSLKLLESYKISVVVTANSITDKGVSWSSTDSSIASVNLLGSVVGVSTGQAFVIATSVSDSTKIDSVQVTVSTDTLTTGIITSQPYGIRIDLETFNEESILLISEIDIFSASDRSTDIFSGIKFQGNSLGLPNHTLDKINNGFRGEDDFYFFTSSSSKLVYGIGNDVIVADTFCIRVYNTGSSRHLLNGIVVSVLGMSDSVILVSSPPVMGLIDSVGYDFVDVCFAKQSNGVYSYFKTDLGATINSVTIMPQLDVYLHQGASFQLSHNIDLIGYPHTEVIWEVVDTALANISSTGLVTGLNVGITQVVLSSTYDATKRDTASLTVLGGSPVSSFNLIEDTVIAAMTPSSRVSYIGNIVTYTGIDSSRKIGHSLEVNAGGDTGVIWLSSDLNVLTVNTNGVFNIVTNQSDTGLIIAYAASDFSKADTVVVIVKERELISLGIVLTGNADNVSDPRINDGVIPEVGFEVHPNTTDGRTYIFSWDESYTHGVFVYYGRVGCCNLRISESTIDFKLNGVSVFLDTIIANNNQHDVIPIVMPFDIAFDEMVLTFAGSPQNFRELEVQGFSIN